MLGVIWPYNVTRRKTLGGQRVKHKRLRIGANGPYRLVLQSVTTIFFFYSYEFSTRLSNSVPAQPYRLFFIIISPYRITRDTVFPIGLPALFSRRQSR